MIDCQQANSLLDARRALIWSGFPLVDAFHATEDKQLVRDTVFSLIADMSVRIDATVLRKSPFITQPPAMLAFYRHAWELHAARVIPAILRSDHELMVIAASIGTRNEQKTIGLAIRDVVDQTGRSAHNTKLTYWPAQSDPCLQVADYCCWAIQRKWERGDGRSFEHIKHLVTSELVI